MTYEKAHTLYMLVITFYIVFRRLQSGLVTDPSEFSQKPEQWKPHANASYIRLTAQKLKHFSKISLILSN